MNAQVALDDPGRIKEIRATIARKDSLRHFYTECYRRFAARIATIPCQGLTLEIGSGGGFIKNVVPNVITSDLLPYDGVDQVVDATKLPYAGESLKSIVMLNTFHHVPDVGKFLEEAQRCLAPGGKLLIVDQHPGIFGYPILKYFHHEPFSPGAKDWEFEASGPLSGANGALAWIVFRRDAAVFKTRYPRLELQGYQPLSPLLYWLSGGLKRWNLVPRSLIRCVEGVERLLLGLSQNFGTFVYIEVNKSARGLAPGRESHPTDSRSAP